MGDCRDEQPSKQVLVDLESGSFPGDETSIKQVFIKCIVVEQEGKEEMEVFEDHRLHILTVNSWLSKEES